MCNFQNTEPGRDFIMNIRSEGTGSDRSCHFWSDQMELDCNATTAQDSGCSAHQLYTGEKQWNYCTYSITVFAVHWSKALNYASGQWLGITASLHLYPNSKKQELNTLVLLHTQCLPRTQSLFKITDRLASVPLPSCPLSQQKHSTSSN